MTLFATALKVKQLLSPGNPDAGSNSLYPKADGKWYSKNSAGTEILVGPDTIHSHTYSAPDWNFLTTTGWISNTVNPSAHQPEDGWFVGQCQSSQLHIVQTIWRAEENVAPKEMWRRSKTFNGSWSAWYRIPAGDPLIVNEVQAGVVTLAADPVNAQDAATKQYVDDSAGGSGGPGTLGPRARMYKTTNQTVPQTFNAVTFEAAEYSVPSTFADLAGDRLVIPEDGPYTVVAYVNWAATAGGGVRSISMHVNGTLWKSDRRWPSGNQQSYVTITTTRQFVAGDIITLDELQQSGGDLAILSGITASCLEATKIVVGQKGDTGAAGPPGSTGPPGPDEILVQTSQPSNPAIDLWVDTDDDTGFFDTSRHPRTYVQTADPATSPPAGYTVRVGDIWMVP